MRVNQRQARAYGTGVGGDAKANQFLANAMRFKGQPYAWGGGHGNRTGVQPVDGSGLVGQAARMAGVRFEGRARDMQARARKIAMKDLRPGDLVFKGSPARHVGIYMGNGQVLHAPSRGKPVQVTGMGGWTSAGRIPGMNGGAPTRASQATRPLQEEAPAARQHHARRHVARDTTDLRPATRSLFTLEGIFGSFDGGR